MARVIRLWEKKRGERRTGSRTLGSVGEAFFFAIMFLLGAILLADLVSTELAALDLKRFQPGFGFWLKLLVRASLLVIGGAGVIYTVLQVGASAERRSAMARKAANLDLIGDASVKPQDYPTVPSDANLINSPGVKAAYRLPTSHTPAWGLAAATVFCLLWTTAAAFMAVIAVNDVVAGNVNWFFLSVAAAFVIVGVASLIYFLRQLAVQTALGPTQVEISEHPFRPGQRYDVFVLQEGHLNVRRLEMWLICQEKTTFTQGTDIRTEARTIFRHQVFQRDDFKIDPAAPFELKCLLEPPATAMHSFVSRHNSIDWSLEVRGDVRSWPALERRFPVIVYPAASPSEAAPAAPPDEDAA